MSNPLCTDCKWHSYALFSRDPKISRCYSPKNEKSPVDGKPEPMYAQQNRMWGPCGSRGKLFEPKSERPPPVS